MLHSMVVASAAGRRQRSETLTHEASDPMALTPELFQETTIHCNPSASLLVDELSRTFRKQEARLEETETLLRQTVTRLDETRLLVDLADATTETAKKARARFFEQSKQAFSGRLTKEELGVIRKGNEAVHHRNSSLQQAFRLLMDFHDTASKESWNRFRSSSTSPEARSWALIREMKENKGPIYGESGQGPGAV